MGIEKFVVSRHERFYQAWPDVALTRSGRLICCFSQCTHHGDRGFARFVTVVSDDAGHTWTEPRVLVGDSDEGYWNCPRVTALSDGRLVIVGDKVIGRERTDPAKMTNWLWLSDDDGETWSRPHATPVAGIVPDKVTELSSGRWLLAAHWESPQHGFKEERVWRSGDAGRTWDGPAILGSKAGLNLCEASILELPGGDLVAFIRENSFKGWDAFKTFSHDAGETWSQPYATVLSGCHRPVSGWLRSGRCLVTYRFIPGGKGGWGRWTQNFFGALMLEASVRATQREQQWARILPIDFDRHRFADLGYSGWVQFPDGEILIVNYLLDDWDRGQIRGYRLTEEAFGDFADD